MLVRCCLHQNYEVMIDGISDVGCINVTLDKYNGLLMIMWDLSKENTWQRFSRDFTDNDNETKISQNLYPNQHENVSPMTDLTCTNPLKFGLLYIHIGLLRLFSSLSQKKRDGNHASLH